MHRLFRPLLLAATISLLIPALAAAHPGNRSLARTFPHAERLCHRVQAGRLPAPLAADASQLTDACNTLSSAYDTDQTALITAVQQARAGVATARTELRTTVAQARQNHDHAAAQAARQTFRQAVHATIAQLRTAVKQYVTATQAARRAFWTTVHSLRGGAQIPADTTVPAPSVPAVNTAA